MLTADWRSDFRRLWAATAASQVGSAVATGGLALVAVLVLDAPAWQVAMLAAVSGIGAAVAVLPIGPLIEFRRKRPAMVAAQLVTAAALASVPIAIWFGVLTYPHLVVVGVAHVVGAMTFAAAGGAHLKGLVPEEERVAAQSRLDATFWTSNTVGPAVGGALVSLLGPAVVLVSDACSCLATAWGIGRMRTPEPTPPTRGPQHHWRREVVAGWRHVWRHRRLRALFVNSLFFGGGVMTISSMLAIFLLRELDLQAWHLGVVLGVSSGAALVGSTLTPRIVRRWGQERVLLVTGIGRSLWMLPLVVAPTGVAGFWTVLAAEVLMMCSVGVFNPTFTSLRMEQTPDAVMARVTAAWSVSQKTIQPVCIALGGVVAAAGGLRTAVALGAVLVLTSAFFLPKPSSRPRLKP